MGLKQQINRIVFRYKNLQRHHPEHIFINGVEYVKDCLCCREFSHSYSEWQCERGKCIFLGNVTEWSICRKWKTFEFTESIQLSMQLLKYREDNLQFN